MRIFVFLLISFFFQFLYSQTNEYRTELDKGITAAYNFDFQQSEKIFEHLIDTFPEYPHSYLQLAKMHLWFYMGSGDEGEFGITERYCQLGIECAEKMLDTSPDNPEILSVLGELNTQLAIGSAVNKDTFEAFLKTKSAVGYFEDSIDNGGDYSNNYLWLGVFRYSISFVPGFLKFAISITGLSGDKKEGLDLVRKAVLNDKNMNAEAYFHFSRILTEYCAEYDTAGIYLEKLVNKFPGNVLFKYQLVILKFKQKKLNEAERLINEILAGGNEKFSQTLAFCRFLLGDIYYRRNNFEAALKYYEEFIQLTNTLDYTGIANYRMAICCGMLENNELFRENLEFAKQGNSELPDDEYASEMVEYVKWDGFSKSFRELIVAENNLKNAKYNIVLDSLVNKLDTFKDEEKRGFAEYLIAECSLQNNDYENCKKYAIQAVEKEFEYLNWVKPAAYLCLAKSEYNAGQMDAAKELLSEAEDDANDDTRAGIVNLFNKILTVHN